VDERLRKIFEPPYFEWWNRREREDGTFEFEYLQLRWSPDGFRSIDTT